MCITYGWYSWHITGYRFATWACIVCGLFIYVLHWRIQCRVTFSPRTIDTANAVAVDVEGVGRFPRVDVSDAVARGKENWIWTE